MCFRFGGHELIVSRLRFKIHDVDLYVNCEL